MNWSDVKQAFKEMPAYIRNGLRKGWAYWKNAHPVLWALESVYLMLFVGTFYFVVTYTVAILEQPVEPTGLEFWWIAFMPLTQVGILFAVWGLFSWFAGWIIRILDIPLPSDE